MVSVTTAILACVFGFMLYVMIPVTAMTAPVHIRKKVGTFYLKLGAKCLKQFTFVRRVLSGYDILPISVDDEQKLLQVTLSGSTLSEDSTYRFADPDNRVSRLFGKPVAVAFELVPAAIDAELAEWGYWTRQKEENDGLVKQADAGDGMAADGGAETRVDPYVEADSGLRLVDPLDFYSLVTNDVDSENIKTAEKIAKKRYEKYGDGVDLAQTLRVLIGFGVGAAAVIIMHYINNEMMDSSGGGPPGSGIVGKETLTVAVDPATITDAVVMLA